jgi:hypothetical protein
MKRMRWLAFALVAFTAVGRAEFVAPAEGPVPFRRDKLPVDVDTMAALSRQVLTLTGAPLPEGAEGWRGLAQMTGLALALDPANRQARDLIAKLQAGGAPEKYGNKEREQALSRAWQVAGWLEMPEAGADGQALAACLGDVLVLADPAHPKAEIRREGGEQGAWKDWIAPESAFQPQTTPTPEPSEDPMDDEPPGIGPALAELSLTAPMWVTDKRLEKNVLQFLPVHLSAGAGGEGPPVSIDLPESWEATHPMRAASREVQAFIARRHPTLAPTSGKFSWEREKEFAHAWNGASLSGTWALLMDGAIVGKAPVATAFAVVGKGGKLDLPPRFWPTLRAISAQGKGGRLILPAEAADHLTGLLVLDDAAFFMNHEVLLAETVDELCDLGSGNSKPEIQDVYARFAEIKKVGSGKPIGTFLAHPSTQSRLSQLSASMPQHASARLLALQGSGNRPRFLQRAVLAQEVRDALQPIDPVGETTTNKLVSKQLDNIHEQCREKLDKMGGYIDIRDRDLHKVAVAAADSMRTLARMMDKKDDDYRYDLLSRQITAHQAAWREYIAALRVLTEAAGDGDEFTIPKPLGGG